MNTEQSIKALQVSAILFKYNVPIAEAKVIGTFIEELIQENQELKRNCNIGYENLNFYREENQELKKQLEENKDKINWYENFEINKTIDKLRIKHNNQQKEFIEYLENMLDNENDIFSVVRVKDVLSKYKEIIGVDNE